MGSSMYFNVMMATTEMEMDAQKIVKSNMATLVLEAPLIIVIHVIHSNLTELHLHKLVKSENQPVLF